LHFIISKENVIILLLGLVFSTEVSGLLLTHEKDKFDCVLYEHFCPLLFLPPYIPVFVMYFIMVFLMCLIEQNIGKFDKSG